MTPVLVPAFPAVLRASPFTPVQMPSGCFDLRDPAVRDAVVRCIWRAVHRTTVRPLPDVVDMVEVSPGVWEPAEPLTAPTFGAWSCHGWELSPPGLDDAVVFWTDNNPPHDWRVPALASVPLDSPDRDLLALAAVACAVLA